jgi:UDP-glucose 4-epimerase
MKLAITGASGQLGSYLLDDLAGKHEVIGIDLLETHHAAHQDLVHRADIRTPMTLSSWLKGVDVVIHCAAQVSVENSIKDPISDMDTNVRGTVGLLQACKEMGVGKFVYVSTAAVYGDPVHIPISESHPRLPKSFYGVSKASAEDYVRVFTETKGLDHVIVRPFNFYSRRADPKSPYSGVITKFVQMALANKPLTVEGDGLQTRDFIHASDVAAMISTVACSDVKNQTFNCASGKGTSINELAKAVLRASPNQVDVVHIAPRVGDIRHSVGDISKARKMLDFEPKMSLDQGMASLF